MSSNQAERPGKFPKGALLLAVAVSPFLFIAAFGQEQPQGAVSAHQLSEQDQSCMGCHAAEADAGPAVDVAALKKTPHAEFSCTDCHSSITEAPHTEKMLAEKAKCADCHTEQTEAFSKSLHAATDFVPGDHPSCVMCHGGGNPHAITAGSKWTRSEKVQVCRQCHEQDERMKRYHVDTDAVRSYLESFHGKALLRFGKLDVAICTDCHGHHDVLSPQHPAAPTNRNNAAKTCSQEGCHAGAKLNFAMSGANHLRLKVKDEPILAAEEWLFRILTGVTIFLLLVGVMLDVRRQLIRSKGVALKSRVITVLISLAYVSVIVSLVTALVGASGAFWLAAGSAGFIVTAYVVHFLVPGPRAERSRDEKPKKFLRFTPAQRIQHGFLALSFSALVVTGMPLRYPEIAWLRSITETLGGLEASRSIHRASAIVMIAVWLFHTLYLFYRWKKAGFKVSSWTMLPNRKDLHDFGDTVRYYVGSSPKHPRYDRFQFREKFDYFAVYWGMPIMVFSGLVLWFPVYFGNVLPEVGLSAALIAHGDEAVLAFLAIVLWHFYNTHFTPEHFPMSKVWLTGTLTEDQMREEHPLELEKANLAEQAAEEADAAPGSSSNKDRDSSGEPRTQ